MKMRLYVITLLLMASFSGAYSQMGNPPPAPLVPTAEGLKAAEAMLVARHMDTDFQRIYYKSYNAAIASMDESKRANYTKVTKKFLDTYCSWAAVKDTLIKSYAQTYTIKELKQMTAFYKTPAGQKVAEMEFSLFDMMLVMQSKILQIHLNEIGRDLGIN